MTQKAPGKHYRKGISLIEIFDTFPDNASAEKWFTEVRLPHRVRIQQPAHCLRTSFVFQHLFEQILPPKQRIPQHLPKAVLAMLPPFMTPHGI